MRMLGTFLKLQKSLVISRNKAKIMILFDIPNDIELLCPKPFQMADHPSQAAYLFKAFIGYGAQDFLSSLF